MVSLAGGDKATRLVRDVKDIDLDDLYDQLENLRDYVHELSQSVGKSASRQYGRARAYTSEAAKEAEELMKDNLAASLILALGLGLVVGYLIRRSTEEHLFLMRELDRPGIERAADHAGNGDLGLTKCCRRDAACGNGD